MPPLPSTRARAATHAAAFIPRGRWQLSEACGVCGRAFGVLRGRHHCRHCGMSVCARHSRHREVVPSSLSSLRQRVCDECVPACQRGVTRVRRRTVGARTFSVRFDGEDDASTKAVSADSVAATATMTTATTMCTTSTIASEPVTPLDSPKHRKLAPRSPRENLARTFRAAAAAAAAAAPANERTSATARRRYADSTGSSSSGGSCSFSSLDDHSSSSSEDDDADSSSSDDEELIAKYLRRGAPLRSPGNAVTHRSAASGSILGRHDSLPLEAIKEKQALDSPSAGSSEDSYDANAALHEQQHPHHHHHHHHHPHHYHPLLTPPTRLNLQAVAIAYSAAVKAAAERKRLAGKGDREAKQAAVLSAVVAPAKPKPPPPASGTAASYQITEQERRVMQEIAALELEIQKHQSELPALLEKLQQSERTAARLLAEAREAQVRVELYQKAERVVARSVRSARALMREREFQAAILELLRASGIDRASASVWHLLAECRLEISQLDAAEHACRKSLRLRQQQSVEARDMRPSLALLGRILHAQGRQDEAIECYLAALER